jgi:hypothetical protein
LFYTRRHLHNYQRACSSPVIHNDRSLQANLWLTA